MKSNGGRILTIGVHVNPSTKNFHLKLPFLLTSMWKIVNNVSMKVIAKENNLSATIYEQKSRFL